jgi:lipoprotein signal peptidase
MNASQIFIVLSVVILVIIAVLVFFIARSKKEKMLTPLTELAFGFILAGMLFSNDRLLNYSLMGIGVIISIFDMFRKLRTKKQNEK